MTCTAAVDASLFKPDPSQRSKDKIVIVALSRLVYRKGIDLLAAILPDLCVLDPRVHILIGGDSFAAGGWQAGGRL